MTYDDIILSLLYDALYSEIDLENDDDDVMLPMTVLEKWTTHTKIIILFERVAPKIGALNHRNYEMSGVKNVFIVIVAHLCNIGLYTWLWVRLRCI